MQFALKKYKHAPAHLYLDEGYYFFTGAVYQKQRFLRTPKTREIFIEFIFQFIEK